MRSLAESSARWKETTKHGADLQRAVRHNGPESPCIAGLRSICWKTFLLGSGSSPTSWHHALLESRSTYASLKDHFLKYIEHPEYLATASVDPLADDPESPWNTSRQDEAMRAEILQDVQRLPDEPFYHEPRIQTMILDVLFIYCKLNPDVGGYRQGMHELLAPMVYVVEQDAINKAEASGDGAADLTMIEMLDAAFVEHDAFALFSRLMDHAKAFYETGDGTPGGQSSIVEKSQYIHEGLLYSVDPDLSTHLTNVEILPQIFLIRWVRLLFGREFPFDQMLVLWDTLFCVDPTLQLVDLVCTALMLRIRWALLEADSSMALQLLLKYPPPPMPHGPHTFIDDAVYLRDHLTPAGGSALIMKYTGRPPAAATSPPRVATPKSFGLGIRQNLRGAKSPLSPQRFLQQQGGVEALFQGAAKGVLERGEKLGLNQAVRDALVEIRRNVSEAKSSIKTGRDQFPETPHNTAMQAVAAMDRRNKQLAAMLDETVETMKQLASSPMDDKRKHTEALEIAAAKVQFVKIYLEDSTMALPEEEHPLPPQTAASQTTPIAPEPPSDAVAAMVISTPTMAVDSPDAGAPKPAASQAPPASDASEGAAAAAAHPDAMETDPLSSSSETLAPEPTATTTTKTAVPPPQRPHAPMPTRSTLAQSSFSWMLEPDEAPSSQPDMFPPSGPGQSPPHKLKSTAPHASAAAAHRKRPSANANRERTAFLFGEVPSDAGGNVVLPEDLFGLEPLKKDKK